MLIKCWGSRGSIPVSGPEYSKYGGDTTCIEIQTKSGDRIIVDAGTGVRRLGNQLVQENNNVYHFLFTHSHWDHLIGFPFFQPLYLPESKIKIYRCPFPGNFIEVIVSKMMGPPHFPVRYSDLKAEIQYFEACPSDFQIGSVTVVPIPLSHPNSGCGYKFIEDGKSFVFLTDNELGYIHPGGLKASDYAVLSSGADILFHDAEYTAEEYTTSIEWGHSTFEDAMEMALRAEVKQLGFFHLNRERSDSEMDQIVDRCSRTLAEKNAGLKCFGVGIGMEFEI
jgi:phosphoribosyl 1,2-cyclic phosphodiesterase